VQLNKIKLTTDSSERLKQLKAKTGLTPNILCRIGFCLSLKDSTLPDPEKYPEEDREFNRYTLLGEWDSLFVALLRQRLLIDGVADHSEEEYFRAHINRGVYLLSRQVKCLADILCVTTR
jgi:DNA sulfur modification protein DndE